MRQPDFPLDPELMAELDAIDATLGGRIVDPEFADLAELTVMVAAERQQLEPDRARALDERVLGQLGPAAPRQARRRTWRAPAWAGGLSVAVAAAVAVVVVGLPGGGSGTGSSAGSGPGLLTPAMSKPSAGAGAGGTVGAGSSAPRQPQLGLPQRAAMTPQLTAPPANGGSIIHGGSTKGSASGSFSGAGAGVSGQALNATPNLNGANSTAAGPTTPAPVPSARKTIQSAQLQLSARGRWIDVVSQEVYDVVGQEKGIVRNSQVTASTGNNGYATFNLSIPSGNLADTVTRLSALQHAQVVSRTDGTQDVNGPYLADQRHLSDAEALHTSLLKQLANATTQAQIDSLRARIRSAEAQINSDQATLHRLQYQISFSQLFVSINGGPIPLPLASSSHSSGGGLTIGKAAHDALNVLTVAAGVALIALAALVPLGLLIALAVWVRLAVRRHRREQALDAA